MERRRGRDRERGGKRGGMPDSMRETDMDRCGHSQPKLPVSMVYGSKLNEILSLIRSFPKKTLMIRFS